MTTQPPQLSTMRILWGALLASVLIYPVILVVTRKVDALSPGPEPAVVMALTVTALAVGAMSFVLPRVLQRNAVRAQAAKLVGEEQRYPDEGRHGFRDAATAVTAQTIRDPARAEGVALRTYMTRFILEMALAEAVANVGLVLGFLGLGLARALPFFVAAVALQAIRFPTRERALAALEDALGARFPGSRME